MILKKFATLIITLIFSLQFGNLQCIAKSNYFATKRNSETLIIDSQDYKTVFSETTKTLQDNDFVINILDPELGIITASKTFKKTYTNKNRVAGQSFLLALFTTYTVFSYGSTAYSMYAPSRHLKNEFNKKNSTVEIFITIQNFGKDKIKLRLTLKEKILENADGFSFSKEYPLKVEKITNQELYNEFFNQLLNGINNKGL